MSASGALLRTMLARRLEPAALAWCEAAEREVAAGAPDERFGALLSLASRHARRRPLAPSREELAQAEEALPGWSPERWSVLDALRTLLVLARPDLDEASGERALESALRYADEGELVALHRSLAHLPRPERFVRRAAEGCRTNMRSVFEAAALDTPYPRRWFDDVAWRQAVIKCVFIGAPLWRLWGLDERLSPELARMALDLVDERRSAGRPVPPELWLALGPHGGQRALAALERELGVPEAAARVAAAWALSRAGATERLARFVAEERDGAVRDAAREGLAGPVPQGAFRALDPVQRGTTS